jgi:hypothetical protein
MLSSNFDFGFMYVPETLAFMSVIVSARSLLLSSRPASCAKAGMTSESNGRRMRAGTQATAAAGERT